MRSYIPSIYIDGKHNAKKLIKNRNSYDMLSDSSRMQNCTIWYYFNINTNIHTHTLTLSHTEIRLERNTKLY